MWLPPLNNIINPAYYILLVTKSVLTFVPSIIAPSSSSRSRAKGRRQSERVKNKSLSTNTNDPEHPLTDDDSNDSSSKGSNFKAPKLKTKDNNNVSAAIKEEGPRQSERLKNKSLSTSTNDPTHPLTGDESIDSSSKSSDYKAHKLKTKAKNDASAAKNEEGQQQSERVKNKSLSRKKSNDPAHPLTDDESNDSSSKNSDYQAHKLITDVEIDSSSAKKEEGRRQSERLKNKSQSTNTNDPTHPLTDDKSIDSSNKTSDGKAHKLNMKAKDDASTTKKGEGRRQSERLKNKSQSTNTNDPTHPLTDDESIDSSSKTSDDKAHKLNMKAKDDASATKKEEGPQSYPDLSHVHAASFLTIKLSGKANYVPWDEQITCLLESLGMADFINDSDKNPKEDDPGYKEWKRKDTFLKGWIFGSLSEDVMARVVGCKNSASVWTNLTDAFCPSDAPITTISEGPQSYLDPSHVHAASFLTIKLSGKANYGPWEKQIMCLLESLGMIDFIKENPKDDDPGYKVWKRKDTFVKGWIFGSLSEDVMGRVVGCKTSAVVWKKLKETFNPPAAPITTINEEYQSLYGAILSGDWDQAKEIFKPEKIPLNVEINKEGDSPIHVAISTCENIDFVKNLLDEIDVQSLPTLVTRGSKYTLLHRAALVGNKKAAEMLVEKNPKLLFIMDDKEYLPIHRALLGSHEETFRYLLEVTKKYLLSKQGGSCSPFEGDKSAVFLVEVIKSGFLDVACDLIKEYPGMANEKEGNFIALSSIAGNLDAYYSCKSYSSYQKFIYSCIWNETEDVEAAHGTPDTDLENQDTSSKATIVSKSRSCFHSVKRMIYLKFQDALLNVVPGMKNLQREKVKHSKALKILRFICEKIERSSDDDIGEHYLEAIILALENDIPEVIQEINQYIPQAIWAKHDDYQITQFAIVNRCEKVYNLLLHKMVVPDRHVHKTWLNDKDGNTLLHLAGRLAPMDKLNLVSGAAAQMQRELQWFNEVQNIVLHEHINHKNKNQETPIMVFRKEHKDLRKEGEEWMKKTADSYTITAALIITIVFAAAITVPGGNNGDTGKAIFAKRSSFIIFAVADAISLFSSTTSLLLFLSILTARYRDEDFLYRLPKRLIIGLTMLFLAVTSMMVAFSATLYIMFGQEKGWVLIPIATFTCLPIASFVTLQLPLLVDLISSTYGHGIFDKQSDRKIKLE